MRPVDLLLVVVVNCAWGFNFIAGKIGAEEFQPLFFTAIRFFLLLIITLPWLRPARGYMMPLLRVSFLLGTIHFGMIFIGLHGSGNIGSVAIATQLYVPFSALLAVVFLGERIPFRRFAAIVTAFAGVMIIGFDPVVLAHLASVLWVIGAALAMAVATILMRQCPKLGVFRLQAWIALVAAPSLMVLSLIFETDHLRILEESSPRDFWAPLYSAVGASIIGHGTVYYLLGRYPVAVVTPLLLAAPILATIFGVFWFDDTLGWRLVVGGLITLVAILVLSINHSGAKALKRRGTGKPCKE